MQNLILIMDQLLNLYSIIIIFLSQNRYLLLQLCDIRIYRNKNKSQIVKSQ